MLRPATTYELSTNCVEDAFPEIHIPESGPASFGGRVERVVGQHYMGSSLMTSSSVKRDDQRRCVFDETAPGDLAVPERVDVCPLLLDRATRRLDEASLVTQDDDRIALRDELAWLETLELERFPEHREELRDALVPVASTGPRDHGGAGQAPLYVVGQKV